MKSMLSSMAIVLTFCAAPAIAAEFPKTGEAEYDTYYVGNPVAKIDSGAGTGTIVWIHWSNPSPSLMSSPTRWTSAISIKDTVFQPRVAM